MIEVKKLKHYFGDDFEVLLKQASDTLELLGVELLIYKNQITAQFDYEKIIQDPVALLVFCIITKNDPPSKKEPLAKKSFSQLSRPELAILAILLGLVEKEKRPTVPITSMKEHVQDIFSDQIISKALTQLSHKGYLSHNEKTVSVNSRLQVELGHGVTKVSTMLKEPST